MNYLGLLYPMLILNFAIAVGIVRYRRRQIAHLKRLRARQLEEFEGYKREVAGELHDHFGQVKMQFAKLLRSRGEAVDSDLANTIIDLEGEFSNINEVLYPAGVESGDVAMLLQRLAATSPAIIRFDGPAQLVTTPSRALHIFRIVQETVSNAIRHSRPERLDLQLIADPQGILRIVCHYDTHATHATHDATSPAHAPTTPRPAHRGRGQSILQSRLTILDARHRLTTQNGWRTETFVIPTAA